MGIVLLSAMVRIVMAAAKELVVLGIIRFIMMILVIVSYIYTVSYINKCDARWFVRETEGYYVLILILVSISVANLNFTIWIRLIILGMRILYWVGNPMSTIV